MKYVLDHDFHIHTQRSYCSNDDEQNPQTILKYGEENGFSTLCLTDHMWDGPFYNKSGFYPGQDYEHVSSWLPLPESDKVKMLFGCETDLDKDMNVGVRPEMMDKFDFIIIPINHMHMHGFTISEENYESVEVRKKTYINRFDKLLDKDLPFEKIGLAHLTCDLGSCDLNIDGIAFYDLIEDETYRYLFEKAVKKGVGIELNMGGYGKHSPEERERMLRPYKIAKECGAKFYFGSDAHHPQRFENVKAGFELIRDELGLEETDKFIIPERK